MLENLIEDVLDRRETGYDEALRLAIKAIKDSAGVLVTEKIPKVNESVLATTVWNDVTIAWRIGVDKWFIHDGGTNATTEDLIAWMPLPEPYKE